MLRLSWRGCLRRSLSFSPANRKQPPCVVWFFCFLLDRGAGGIRTRVQSWRPYAFYMLIPAPLSGSSGCRTTLMNLSSCYLAFRPEQPSGQPRFPRASVPGWLAARPPGRRPAPDTLAGMKLKLLCSFKQRERN